VKKYFIVVFALVLFISFSIITSAMNEANIYCHQLNQGYDTEMNYDLIQWRRRFDLNKRDDVIHLESKIIRLPKDISYDS